MSVNRLAASLALWLGVGVAWGGTLTANPSPVNFGNVSVSGAAVSSTVVLSNATSSTTIFGLVLSSGCNEFSVSGPSFPVTLGAGTTLNLNVSYDPVDRAGDTCTVTPTSSGTGGAFVLTGDGVAPVLSVTPSSLNFPAQRWNGGPTTTLNLTLENLGDESFSAAQLVASLSVGTQFSIGPTGGFPVPPAGSGTLTIGFDPASVGAKTDTLTLFLSNGSPTQPNSTVSLSGTGIESTQTFTPASTLDVGTVLLGSSATNNLVIGNSGSASLTLSGSPAMMFTGTNAADFSFTDHGCAGQICNPTANVIAAGGSTTFAIRCTPSAVGTRSATLTVRSDDPASPRTLTTTCTGTAPVLTTTPASSFNFGVTQVGQTSPTQDLSIRNGAGAAPLNYSITSNRPAEFPLSCAGGGTGCLSGTVAAGAVATVQVAFVPQMTGARSSTLVIVSDDPDSSPYQLTVNGTGGLPVLSAPASFSLGNVPIAQAGGATADLTLSNTGSVPLDIAQMTITGAADFSFAFGACTSGQTCSSAISVAPASSTLITLRCDPSTIGNKTGTLTITSDEAASPRTIALTCTATAAANGASCVAASECVSGFCVDGVCCDTGCADQCRSCALTNRVGTCSAVTGAPVGSRPACNSDGSACGGACDGTSNTCVYPGASTSCRAGSCDGGVALASASCDGTGACPAVQTQTCEPYVCGATGCRGNCTTDLECANTSYCASGVCTPKLALGASCAAEGQCVSGFCADGVCCNESCGAQCAACDLNGLRGTCSPIPSGPPHGGRTACSGMGACMGQCDGTSSTSCAPATGTSEVCNGADDDCDGVVDDGISCGSDAGSDAGNDAGSPEDAGAASDAGTGSDAGTMMADAGMMTGEPSGCGCGVSQADLSLVLMQLALLLGKRRRARR